MPQLFAMHRCAENYNFPRQPYCTAVSKLVNPLDNDTPSMFTHPRLESLRNKRSLPHGIVLDAQEDIRSTKVY